MTIIRVLILGLNFLALPILAQTAGAPPAPTDRAVILPLAELQAAAEKLAVDGILTRRMLEGGIFSINVRHIEAAETALQHGRITEVWVVRDGSGILVTGGSLVDQADGSGPGEYRGSGIRGGEERLIQAGDVVFVPPGVPHGIRETASITYLNIRFELRD